MLYYKRSTFLAICRMIASCVLIVFFVLPSFAQKIDAVLSDTSGMAADLKTIGAQIGPLASSIKDELTILSVQYYSFDSLGQADTQTIHQGVLVVHKSVAEDLQAIFKELEAIKFPIEKVIPVNRYGLNSDHTGWDDDRSMEDNNTSGFNYRYITNSKQLSPHGMGIAIDFNPRFNPFESYHHDGKFIAPSTGFYNPQQAGTITDSLVVGYFDKRGWTWGGRWNNPVDFQHFDKRPGRSRKHYLMKESAVKNYFRYGNGDGTLALYDNPQSKEQDRPSIFLYKNDRSHFLAYWQNRADQSTCRRLFIAKGQRSWATLIKAEAKRGAVVPRAKTTPKKRANWSSSQPLTGIKIALYLPETEIEGLQELNEKVANGLKIKLAEVGADVFIGREGVQPSANFNTQLNLVIGLGNETMYATPAEQPDNYQVLYVPGAYRVSDLQTTAARMQFLYHLISDALPKSIQLAKELQEALKKTTGLSPVSRQLTSPNSLETTCIKTDIDGIYCKYLDAFQELIGPTVYVAPYTIDNAEALMDLKQKGDEISQKVSVACYEGILQYLKK